VAVVVVAPKKVRVQAMQSEAAAVTRDPIEDRARKAETERERERDRGRKRGHVHSERKIDSNLLAPRGAILSDRRRLPAISSNTRTRFSAFKSLPSSIRHHPAFLPGSSSMQIASYAADSIWNFL